MKFTSLEAFFGFHLVHLHISHTAFLHLFRSHHMQGISFQNDRYTVSLSQLVSGPARSLQCLINEAYYAVSRREVSAHKQIMRMIISADTWREWYTYAM